MAESKQQNSPDQFKVDSQKNSETLKISEEIYLKILNKAIDQTSQDIQDFQEALTNDDNEKVKGISHKLKGDYDNLRISEMSLIAKEINDIAKVEFKKEKISQLFSDFSAYFDLLKKNLAA